MLLFLATLMFIIQYRLTIIFMPCIRLSVDFSLVANVNLKEHLPYYLTPRAVLTSILFCILWGFFFFLSPTCRSYETVSALSAFSPLAYHLKVQPCFCQWQSFFLSHSLVFHCACMPRIPYPFVNDRHLGYSHISDYCKWCHSTHVCKWRYFFHMVIS